MDSRWPDAYRKPGESNAHFTAMLLTGAVGWILGPILVFLLVEWLVRLI